MCALLLRNIKGTCAVFAAPVHSALFLGVTGSLQLDVMTIRLAGL